MEAQEVVHYGWHDCLNGRRRAAEGETQILSVLETMPDTTFYTDCFVSDEKWHTLVGKSTKR